MAFVLGTLAFGACAESEDPELITPPLGMNEAGVVAAPDATSGSPEASTITPPPQQEASVPVPVLDAGVDSAIPVVVDAGGDAGDAGPVVQSDAGDGGGTVLKGECCKDGDCLCHGPAPTGLTSAKGPFKTASIDGMTGKIHYPTDAEPPFAAVALCGGFLNLGPEMDSWGPFYASYGIVTIITSTLPSDFPEIRADHLANSVKELQAKNTQSGNPLFGKLSGRYGTSGYSMGGGGTTHATVRNPMLKSSVGLAAWSPVGANVKVPTLLLCGSSDGTAPCSQSMSSYRGIPETTPKMMVTIAGATHFNWFGPTDAGRGLSGQYALAFQKAFLEGDERWLPILKMSASGATVQTNIK